MNEAFGIFVITKDGKEKGLPIWKSADPIYAGRSILLFCHRNNTEAMSRFYQSIHVNEEEEDPEKDMEDAFWRFERGEDSVFLEDWVEEIDVSDRVRFVYRIDLDRNVLSFIFESAFQREKMCYEYPLGMIRDKSKSVSWEQIRDTVIEDMYLYRYLNEDFDSLFSEDGGSSEDCNLAAGAYSVVIEQLHKRNVSVFRVWDSLSRTDRDTKAPMSVILRDPGEKKAEQALQGLIDALPDIRPSDREKAEQAITELTRMLLGSARDPKN